MKKYLLICIYCLFIIAGNAQESPQDSLLRQQQTEKELKKQKKAARNFHYNILGGPSYTPDFGLLIGGSALMTFRMNPKDTTMRRSVIPASVAFMFNGGTESGGQTTAFLQERPLPYLRTVYIQEYPGKLLWGGIRYQQELCTK